MFELLDHSQHCPQERRGLRQVVAKWVARDGETCYVARLLMDEISTRKRRILHMLETTRTRGRKETTKTTTNSEAIIGGEYAEVSRWSR